MSHQSSLPEKYFLRIILLTVLLFICLVGSWAMISSASLTPLSSGGVPFLNLSAHFIIGAVAICWTYHILFLPEKYFLRIIIIVLLLVISLPYVWAWMVTPQGFHYSGMLYNPDDQNVHLAWARQAAEGHLTISDVFTSESLDGQNRPLFVNLYTWSIGTVTRFTHLPLVLVSHLFRLLFAALAITWFYRLCCHFTEERRTRYMAVLFAAFSTGVGFLLPLFPGLILIDRPDMAAFPMMPEAYIFTSAFIFGLNIASLALLALIYEQLLRAQTTRSWKHVGVAAAAAFIVANIHTYDAIPLIGVLCLWLVWKLARYKNALPKSTFPVGAIALVIAGAVLPVIYQWWVFQNDVQFRLKAVTYTAAPPLMNVLISYGLVFVLAIAGVAWICRKWRDTSRPLLLAVWVVVTLAAIYLPRWLGHPLSFERKMIEGIHWPLCLLAAMGLSWILSAVKSHPMKNLIASAALIFCCISSFQFIGWCLANAQDNNSSRANVLMPPLYLSAGDAAAMDYLREHGDRHKAVLCLTFAGNYLPGKSGMTVYLGHWAETVDYKEKLSQAIDFMTGKMTQNEARRWLHENHIGYVLMGSYEQQLGATLPLPLNSVFSEAGSSVYKVD